MFGDSRNIVIVGNSIVAMAWDSVFLLQEQWVYRIAFSFFSFSLFGIHYVFGYIWIMGLF